jgi:hypothetical protein
MDMDIAGTMKRARKDFELKKIDPVLLRVLYTNYNDVPDPQNFIQKAMEEFPHLACGVATAYLQHMLSAGTIVRGRYLDNNHTFLLLEENRIADITADQYGGPRIYNGHLKHPWALS